MIEKMKKNIKLTLILLAIFFALEFFINDFSKAMLLITDYWFVWVILPFALRFWNWFNNLKQRAFNYGAKSTDKNIEKLATQVDKAANISKKRYDLLKKNAKFSKKEAKAFRESRTSESVTMESEMTKDKNFFIPLFRYVKGLPGKNLVRSSQSESTVVAGKIAKGNLEFYECDKKDYDGTIPTKKKISSIPLGSIYKLEIIDLTDARVLRKVGAHLTDRVTKTIVRTVTPGVMAEKQSVDAAKLNIHYINEDGVVMAAVFVFPSNCKVGKQSAKMLSQLNRTIGGLGYLGKLAWHSDMIPANDLDEDDFDLDEVSALTGDMMTVLKWTNLLSGSDNAIFSAKLSAEMIAGLLLDDNIELLETTDKEENPS